MKRFLCLLPLLALAAPARAGVHVGVNQAFGTNDYEGTNVYAALSAGGWSLAPEYRRFSINSFGSPFHTVQARLGYDTRWAGAGVTGGKTAKQDGYSSAFGGGDFAFTLSAGGEEGIRRVGGPGRSAAPVGKGIARFDFGGGFLTTQHEQSSAVAGAAEHKLTQSEIHGFVGASILGVLLSARGSKFEYNEAPKDRATLPAAVWTPISGHTSYTNGFAQESFHLRGEFTMLPLIRPNLHYTFTRYAELAGGVRPGDTRAAGFGVAVGLELLAVEASYQHVSTTGSAKDSNLVSIGATLRI